MTEPRVYRAGDRVRHAGRPEWGTGLVRAAEKVIHDGQPAQRLVIDFAARGRATVNTAVARIEPADGSGPEPEAPVDLSALPEAVNDPLSGPLTRFGALLDLFRFEPTSRGLIDWAMMQTHLEDPLSRYDRHELELAYRRFIDRRNQLLIEMLSRFRKEGRMAEVAGVLEQTGQAVRQAVARVLKGEVRLKGN